MLRRIEQTMAPEEPAEPPTLAVTVAASEMEEEERCASGVRGQSVGLDAIATLVLERLLYYTCGRQRQ